MFCKPPHSQREKGMLAPVKAARLASAKARDGKWSYAVKDGRIQATGL